LLLCVNVYHLFLVVNYGCYVWVTRISLGRTAVLYLGQKILLTITKKLSKQVKQ